LAHLGGHGVSPGAVAGRAHAHFLKGARWLRLLVLVLHNSAGAGAQPLGQRGLGSRARGAASGARREGNRADGCQPG
nr:hypothetical protein [Tanacetum cinerariifolium]